MTSLVNMSGDWRVNFSRESDPYSLQHHWTCFFFKFISFTQGLLSKDLSENQGVISGVENTKFPSEKYRKHLPVRHYVCLSWTCKQTVISIPVFAHKNFFTCPALMLPVPDRRTACNFHPCVCP